MAAIQHIFKRGSVYWWRRRLPIGTSLCASVRTELSLHIKELELARTIAAEVTLVSHRLLPGLKTKMISSEDAKKILIQVALEHSAHLDSIMATRQNVDRDPDAGRRGEISIGWALRLYAAQGDRAEVGPTEERELRAAGLDDDMLQRVGKTLDFYKSSGFGCPGKQKLQGILAQHDIAPVDVHLRQAEALYMRGMSAALLNTERRWSGFRGDDIAMLQAALMAAPAVDPIPAPMAAKLTQAPIFPTNAAVPAPPSPAPVELVSRAADERVASKEWDSKTGHQHVRLAKLFVRFIGHDHSAKMRQAHIAKFKSIFFKMPKNYGKSPNDFVIKHRRHSETGGGAPRRREGFSTSTINRHMT